MEMNRENLYSNLYMGSSNDYDTSEIVIIGAPMDFTVSYKPGARFGPAKIRDVSYGLEMFSPYLNKTLDDVLFYDGGDLELPLGNVDKSLEQIYEEAVKIIKDKKTPIFMGGEHLISLPVIRAMYEEYDEDLVVLHFDAHADLRDEYLGEKNSHAAVIRRVCEFMNPKNIYQFGIRSGTKDEFDYGVNNTNMFMFHIIEPLQRILESIKHKKVYATIDLDVFDPSYAPGVGTPEPGGSTSQEGIDAIHLLESLDIVGFDIVEACPVYDRADITTILAAKLIREGILVTK